MEKMSVFITGASSGIGKAYAFKLAQKGYDLILLARNIDKLKGIKNELKKLFNTNTKIISSDLSDINEINKAVKLIKSLDNLYILINNAGFGIPGEFSKIDLSKHLSMLNVHINATVSFSHAALIPMLKNNRGIIINVSSIASFLKRKGAVMYSSTKCFITSFSQSLSLEVKEKGIKVQALCPGYTYTEFHDRDAYKNFNRNSIPSFLWTNKEYVVESSLKALKHNKVIHVPGLKNKLFVILLKSRFFSPIINYVLKKIKHK